MSSQRAYINCLKCYDLASEKKEIVVQLRTKDKHHYRDEAMKALEEGNNILGQSGLEYALNECVSCDFSKPKLAQYLKENDSILKKAFKNKSGTNL